ncbi:hypothetical protein [Salinibacterium sp. PAMC 21357]|uniref:hypothetical protein n=1 Tax=Salinibacterium sp. PAMC 21357 TaxID=1112215 RepID=UPI000289CB5F|nr:hypothetical protein [Salinibacterium sp. PAMC 21357]
MQKAQLTSAQRGHSLVAGAVLASGAILSRGKVRKPWPVTFQSLGIVALLDIPLFVVYLSIAAGVTDTAVNGPALRPRGRQRPSPSRTTE